MNNNSKNLTSPSPGKTRGRPRLGVTKLERKTDAGKLLWALEQAPITEYLSYRDFLQALYEVLKKDKPSYSYMQLAEDLGFSRTNVLWLVISGRRKLTKKAAIRVAESLKLKGDDRKYWDMLQRYMNLRRTDEREECFSELIALKGRGLNAEQAQLILEYYSEWHHPVIREMVGLNTFKHDTVWINQHLITSLPPQQILRSLKLLESLKLIEYDTSRARYVQTKGQIMPDRKVERMASVRFHQKMCDSAREAVVRIPANRREMNTLTVTVTDDVAMKISEILYKACEQIMQLEADCKNKDQVYQVNVHMFPFTKKGEA